MRTSMINSLQIVRLKKTKKREEFMVMMVVKGILHTKTFFVAAGFWAWARFIKEAVRASFELGREILPNEN